MIIIMLIGIYIISVFAVRTWFKNVYSKNGRWSRLESDVASIFFTVMPLFNTVMMIFNLFSSPYNQIYTSRKNVDNSPKNFNKFFGIKK